MANINIQRKGIRVTVIVFGPRQAGKQAFLERLRASCKTPGEMMSVPEEGGALLSFFAPVEPRKVDGVELHVRFATAKDERGDGSVWDNVLKQADGVVFVADSAPGQEFENLKAHSVLNQLFPIGAAETALAFFYNKGDVPGAQTKGQLDAELNPGAKPSFLGNAVTGEGVSEAALAATRGTFARFQKQFAEMGGTGSIEGRIALALAGIPTPQPAVLASVPPMFVPPVSAPPAPSKPSYATPISAPVSAALTPSSKVVVAPDLLHPAQVPVPSKAEGPVPSKAEEPPKPSSDEVRVEIDTETFDADAVAEAVRGTGEIAAGVAQVQERPALIPATNEIPVQPLAWAASFPPVEPAREVSTIPSTAEGPVPSKVEGPVPSKAEGPVPAAPEPRASTRELFPGGAAGFPVEETQAFEQKIRSASSAAASVPAMREAVAQAVATARALAARIDDIEKSASACEAATIDHESAQAAAVRLQEAAAAIAALKAENEGLHQHLDGEIASRRHDADAHLQALAQAYTEMDEIRGREERLKALVQERTAEIERHEATAGGSREEIDALRAQAAGFEAQVAELRGQVDHLNGALDAASAREGDLAVRLSEALGEAALAKGEVARAQEEIAAARAGDEGRGAQIADLERQIAGMEIITQERDDLAARAATAAQEVAGLRRGLEGANADMAGLVGRIADAEAKAAGVEAERQALAAQVAAGAARIAEIEGLLAAAQQRAVDAEAAVESERRRAEGLEIEIKKALAQAEGAMRKEASQGVLREQVSSLTALLDRKNRELEVALGQAAEMAKALEEARAHGTQPAADDMAAKLGQELVVLQMELQNRDDQVKMLEAQLNAREGEAQALRSQVSDYARQLQTLQVAQPQPTGPVYGVPGDPYHATTRPVPSFQPAAGAQVHAPPVRPAPTSGVRPAVQAPRPAPAQAQAAPTPAPRPQAPPPAAAPQPSPAPVARPAAPAPPKVAPTPTPPKPVAGPATGARTAAASVPAGFVNQDPAHAGAKQMAKVLVSTFIRKHEKDIVETLKGGTFKKAFDPIVRELRKTYDARVPAQVAATNDYFKEELDAAIEQLKKKA